MKRHLKWKGEACPSLCVHTWAQPSFNTTESSLGPLHHPHSWEQVLAVEQDGRAVQRTKGPDGKVDALVFLRNH